MCHETGSLFLTISPVDACSPGFSQVFISTYYSYLHFLIFKLDGSESEAVFVFFPKGCGGRQFSGGRSS